MKLDKLKEEIKIALKDMVNIQIEELINLGFKDISANKNGLAYRKNLNGFLEICYYTIDPDYIRLQTIETGFTYKLIGVKNYCDLRDFLIFMSGTV